MAEHKPVQEEVMEWACVDGLCEHSTAGMDDCPVLTIMACDTCRTRPDEEIEGFVEWPCEFARNTRDSRSTS